MHHPCPSWRPYRCSSQNPCPQKSSVQVPLLIYLRLGSLPNRQKPKLTADEFLQRNAHIMGAVSSPHLPFKFWGFHCRLRSAPMFGSHTFLPLSSIPVTFPRVNEDFVLISCSLFMLIMPPLSFESPLHSLEKKVNDKIYGTLMVAGRWQTITTVIKTVTLMLLMMKTLLTSGFY